MGIDIGISDEGRKKIADGLAIFLADNYVLYLKTQNFHWNVTGPLFQSLHEMFEQQYTDLATAVDEIAERIRAVGHFAPGSFTQFMEISNLKDQVDRPESAEDMVAILVKDHEQLVAGARKILEIADAEHDDVTVDFVTERMNTHEKTAWMLRSIIS
jgi:starvation-inducible DNA-binding protein